MKMKSILIALFLTLLISMSCTSNKLVTNTSVTWYNLISGEKVSHTFIIKNSSNKNLKIYGITQDCSCVTFKIDKLVIKPGDEAKLKVNLDTLGYVVNKTFRLVVRHSQMQNGAPTIYKLVANIKNYLYSSPQTGLSFRSILYPYQKTSNLKLKIRPFNINENVKIKKIKIGFDFIKYKIVKFRNGQQINFTLNADEVLAHLSETAEQMKNRLTMQLRGQVAPFAQPPVYQENSVTSILFPCKIYIEHPKQKFIRYMISSKILGPIDTDKPENKLVFKNILSSLSRGTTKRKVITFHVFNKYKKNFKITKLSTNNKLVTVKYKKLTSHKYLITMIFNDKRKKLRTIKYNSGHIFIETDQPFTRLIAMRYEIH